MAVSKKNIVKNLLDIALGEAEKVFPRNLFSSSLLKNRRSYVLVAGQ